MVARAAIRFLFSASTSQIAVPVRRPVDGAAAYGSDFAPGSSFRLQKY